MAANAVKVGRYALGERIAAGGMATVHLGRLDGSAGFSRMVAIKRLHPHLCEDPSFTGAFADEARLAARIRHPNVVPTLDVVSTEGELLIVMEYVDGDSLSSLIRSGGKDRVPLSIVVAIVSEMLHGLHSAHEAKSESGKPLDIVHRDVSPQNVLVGADGVARLVDFGIARATAKNRQITTGENDLKGKLAYMAPEQIRRETVTRRADVYAAGIVLWELLTGERLFASENEAATMEKILVGWVQPPRALVPDLPDALNEITLRALDPDPENRFPTAREMAVALEDAHGRALGREVAAWVEKTAAETLATRRAMVARAEKASAPEHTSTSILNEAPTTPRREKLQKTQAQASVPERPPLPTIEPEATATLEMTPTALAPPAVPEPRTGPSLPPSLPPLPLGFEYERTVTSFGEELSRSQRAPARSRTDRIAYAVFGLAVLVTVIVGLSWSKIRGTPPPPPASQIEDPPATAEPVQVHTAEPTVIVPPPPLPPPTPQPAVAPPPARHPVVKPAPVRSAAKQPCVAKTDPATGKKVYTGDCD